MSRLLSNDQVRDFSERAWLPTITQTVFVLAVYALIVVAGFWFARLWYWLVAGPLLGFILAGFLGASHDCAHGTHLPTHSANRLFGLLWSSLVLFNFTIYKHYHLCHHRYTSVEGDTEPRGVFPSVWTYMKALPMFTFYGSFWMMSLRVFRGHYPTFVPKQYYQQVRQDNYVLIIWVVIVTVLTTAAPHIMGPAYLGPLLFCFPMVFLTSIPEHYGCDEGDDVLRNTRSMSSNWLFRTLFWNGNYHAEHHLYPSIPSYRLPRIHRILDGCFQHTGSSYLAFHTRLIGSLIYPNRYPLSTSNCTRHLDATTRVLDTVPEPDCVEPSLPDAIPESTSNHS